MRSGAPTPCPSTAAATVEGMSYSSNGADAGSTSESAFTSAPNTAPTPSPAAVHAPWLRDAVFYEVYPQSFNDTNADGIGDLPGVTAKLDYIASLGATAIWLNPCFDSPFQDAGYDVRDYKKVAPRYGTNQDLVDLFAAAHERGMHVLLDLVAGHTSDEHPWFRASSQPERNEFSDRYIWTTSWVEGAPGLPFIGGVAPRNGTYILNFFACQPALNYGFARQEKPWMQSPDSPAARATRDAMVDVMLYWLELGADGFRCDMADSLVKYDDDRRTHTIAAWRDMIGRVRERFPQAAFVSEWGRPALSLTAGFDMDFYLDWRWDGNPNGYCMLARDTDSQIGGAPDASFFRATSGTGAARFVREYLPQYEESRGNGYFCFITCNHDCARLAPRLSPREEQIAFTMFLTMPGVPYIYYGDEIGMSYRELPTKEGGYTRTGTRTPMQWNGGANRGFSDAPSEKLYLPVDTSSDAPTVAAQEADPESQLNYVRALTALRHETPALQSDGLFTVLHASDDDRAFVYARTAADGSSVVVALNPGLEPAAVELESVPAGVSGQVLLSRGGSAALEGSRIVLPAQSATILR